MATSSPARVLVVDEQLQSRSAIEGMIKKGEYSTVLSSGKDEAIEHLEQDPPYDVVLSDLTMAGVG
jgi:CheY-like chemotaxis protein